MPLFPNLVAIFIALAPAITHAAPQSPYIPEFLCNRGPHGLRLPSKLPAVMHLGPIAREEVIEVEQWEGYTATRKHVYFPGLTLGLVIFSNDPDRYMVSFAEISSPQWAHIAPFHVGESAVSARRKIGTSADNDPNLKATYGSEAGELNFETSNSRITGITYTCYTG